METDWEEAIATGVMVEFRDSHDNTLGQVVYCQWRGRTVPAVGDMLSCDVQPYWASSRAKLSGCVRSRLFDVQLDDSGEPCVWVMLVVDVSHRQAASPISTAWPRAAAGFSVN